MSAPVLCGCHWSKSNWTGSSGPCSGCKSSKRVQTGEPSEIDVSVVYSTGGPNSTLELAVPQIVPSTRFRVILVLPYATIKELAGSSFPGLNRPLGVMSETRGMGCSTAHTGQNAHSPDSRRCDAQYRATTRFQRAGTTGDGSPLRRSV